MKHKEIADIVERIFSLYDKHGEQDYIGERVSQTQHMTQCAMLAERDGYPTEVILAAFFHDIGHLLGLEHNFERMFSPDGIELGTVNHELIGEQFLLDLGFPPELCLFVRNHVQAKRYLVWKNKSYYEGLSDASKGTLLCQGGPMTTDEAHKFEQSPHFDVILKMRQWDELGKDSSAPCDPLDKYKQMCYDYLCGDLQ